MTHTSTEVGPDGAVNVTPSKLRGVECEVISHDEHPFLRKSGQNCVSTEAHQ